jgi:hypothetical protein
MHTPRLTARVKFLIRENIRFSRQHFQQIDKFRIRQLKQITASTRLSLSHGELSMISGKWYVTHSGLLKIAQDRGCVGIRTKLVSPLNGDQKSPWIFQSVVFTSPNCKGFSGYGDAQASNVNEEVRGAELRIAETRAVNRALRKAYGIGLCSVEELGCASQPRRSADNGLVSGFSIEPRPLLRHELHRLVRRHGLDAGLVKRYAADFCGTESLRDASRELVERFVRTLAELALKDKPALIHKLNSYREDTKEAA